MIRFLVITWELENVRNQFTSQKLHFFIFCCSIEITLKLTIAVQFVSKTLALMEPKMKRKFVSNNNNNNSRTSMLRSINYKFE